MSRASRTAQTELRDAETDMRNVEDQGHPEESNVWHNANQRLGRALADPKLPQQD